MKTTTILLSLLAFTMSNVGAADDKVTDDSSSKVATMTEVTVLGNKLNCNNDYAAMADCLSFIKGFLQGALLTDTAIIKSIETSEPSYAERAFKTRLGKRAAPPTALAGFCLPEDRTILDIAEETLDHVKGSQRNSAELAKNVYSSLKKDYPCE